MTKCLCKMSGVREAAVNWLKVSDVFHNVVYLGSIYSLPWRRKKRDKIWTQIKVLKHRHKTKRKIFMTFRGNEWNRKWFWSTSFLPPDEESNHTRNVTSQCFSHYLGNGTFYTGVFVSIKSKMRRSRLRKIRQSLQADPKGQNQNEISIFGPKCYEIWPG